MLGPRCEGFGMGEDFGSSAQGWWDKDRMGLQECLRHAWQLTEFVPTETFIDAGGSHDTHAYTAWRPDHTHRTPYARPSLQAISSNPWSRCTEARHLNQQHQTQTYKTCKLIPRNPWPIQRILQPLHADSSILYLTAWPLNLQSSLDQSWTPTTKL